MGSDPQARNQPPVQRPIQGRRARGEMATCHRAATPETRGCAHRRSDLEEYPQDSTRPTASIQGSHRPAMEASRNTARIVMRRKTMPNPLPTDEATLQTAEKSGNHGASMGEDEICWLWLGHV